MIRLGVLLAIAALSVGGRSDQQKPDISKQAAKQTAYVPRNLDDAFNELDKILKPEEVEKMKAGAEDDMSQYHFGLGMSLRNSWGLWKHSRLAKWFNDIGIHHPDDMSGVILTSYWRHLNGKPLEIQKQVKYYQDYWKDTLVVEVDRTAQEKAGKKLIAKSMMGIRPGSLSASKIKFKPLNSPTLRARCLAPFRGGVFLTIRRGLQPNYTLRPYFFDLRTRRLSQIYTSSLSRVFSSVTIGDSLYVSGTMNGVAHLVVSPAWNKHYEITLPEKNEAPILGYTGSRLIAVYSHSVYERAGSDWILRYMSSNPLPFSGLPPQIQNGFLYLRDEGDEEDNKQLWRIRLGVIKPEFSFDQLAESSGYEGIYWSMCMSYALVSDGSFWASFSPYEKSLVRCSRHKGIEFASVRGSLRSDDKGPNYDLAAVAMFGKRLYAAGKTGLYSLDGRKLNRIVAFEGTDRMMCDDDGEPMGSCDWDPASLLVLSKEKFVLAGMYGGIGLIERSSSGKWSVTMLDHRTGKELRF